MSAILFLGAPGSGKGTQCQRLKEQLGVPHLSTGDLLRQGIEEKNVLCLQAKQYIDKGQLVPDDLITSIFEKRLSLLDCEHGFILDGFPRTLPQAESLSHMLDQLALPLNCVFFLNVPDQLIMERLTGRLVCSSCGAVYHKKTAAPKVAGICDVCGGPLQQRADDREDLVKERLKVYRQLTAPLVDYYRAKNLLIEINGARSQDEIYADIWRNLQLKLQSTGSQERYSVEQVSNDFNRRS